MHEHLEGAGIELLQLRNPLNPLRNQIRLKKMLTFCLPVCLLWAFLLPVKRLERLSTTLGSDHMLLKQDVKEGRTDTLLPHQVVALRPDVYGAFPLDVFRNHLYKERSKQIQEVYWQQKRNKKGASKYLCHNNQNN